MILIHLDKLTHCSVLLIVFRALVKANARPNHTAAVHVDVIVFFVLVNVNPFTVHIVVAMSRKMKDIFVLIKYFTALIVIEHIALNH